MALSRIPSDPAAGGVERDRLLNELRRAREDARRLSLIVDGVDEAITIRGPDNHLEYANRAALERLGFASVEELRAADPRELMGPYETVAEDGREIGLEDIPSVRLLRGEAAEPLLLRSVHKVTGREQWTLLKATALRDGAGKIEAAVTIIEDLTAAKRAALRMEFLDSASQVLASSLDYQQTLRNVAGLVVPRIADWCAIDLFDERRGREQVAVAHSDPAKLALAERLRELEPELDPERGVGRVLHTGEPLLYPEIPDELLVSAAVDEEHLRLLREVGMRAVLIVPMTARARTIGALTLVSAESQRVLDQDDLEFARQIAERAALAVDNARLFSERAAVARTLQQSLLPEALPEIPGWDIAALYRAAGHGNEVGGDLYDFWEVDGEWVMLIGDATGKGAGAAAVTALVRHTAAAASEFDASPAKILSRVDAALKRRPSLSPCTAVCMRISRAQAVIAVAGHPLPLLVGRSGIREVGRHGSMLGAFERARLPETRFTVHPGETLVAFTDGVTDTVGAGGQRFETDRLRATLAETRAEPPAVVRDRLGAALADFQSGAQADDTTFLVMRYSGTRRPARRVAQRLLARPERGMRLRQ